MGFRTGRHYTMSDANNLQGSSGNVSDDFHSDGEPTTVVVPAANISPVPHQFIVIPEPKTRRAHVRHAAV